MSAVEGEAEQMDCIVAKIGSFQKKWFEQVAELFKWKVPRRNASLFVEAN